MHEVDDIMLMTDEKEKMMNKKVAKKIMFSMQREC